LATLPVLFLTPPLKFAGTCCGQDQSKRAVLNGKHQLTEVHQVLNNSPALSRLAPACVSLVKFFPQYATSEGVPLAALPQRRTMIPDKTFLGKDDCNGLQAAGPERGADVVWFSDLFGVAFSFVLYFVFCIRQRYCLP